MLQAAGVRNSFCHACFSGHYPIVPDGELIDRRHDAPLAGSIA